MIKRWSEKLSPGDGNIATLRVAHPWFAWNYEEAIHQADKISDLFKKAREGLERLIPVGKDFNIRYVLEMHGGSLVASAPYARQLLDGLESKYVGIIYDPANGFLEGGIRPRGAVEIINEYLAYVHAKNIIFQYKGPVFRNNVRRLNWDFKICSPEEGMVDYTEIMFALKYIGFNGWISVEEFFAGSDDPAGDIRRAIQYLKECEKAAPSTVMEPFSCFNV